MSADQQQEQKRRRSDIFLGDGRERDDDEQSIIDVFEFDDTANDRWLCSLNRSRRNSVEAGKIEDLDAWLHAEIIESDIAADCNSRRSIDTRTFTRIKRRSNKLSFDGVETSVSPEASPFYLSNIWKNKSIPESNEQVFNNNEKEQCIKNDKRDSIPMMLRPKTNQVLAALLSESPSSISSQTSMEAFMNAAKKDGNSFFLSDISDPDLSSVLMNISQPSLMYSSVMSDARSDDVEQPIINNVENSMIDSQILSDSMMEASMFKEEQYSTNFAQFFKQSNDDAILKDKLFDFNEKTFVNDDFIDKTYINTSDKGSEICDTTFVADDFNSNDTYIAIPSTENKIDHVNSTKIISTPVLNSTRIVINTPMTLNSTRVISTGPKVLENEILSATQILSSEHKTDLTFEVKLPSPIEDCNVTNFRTSDGRSSRSSGSNKGNPLSMNATFNTIPPLRAELLKEVEKSNGGQQNGTFTNLPEKLDVTYECQNPADPLLEVKSLDATYVYVPSKHKSESQMKKPSLDTTYDAMTLASKLSNSVSAPGTQRMSYIPNENLPQPQLHLADPNRFNTFRKDRKIGSRLSRAPQAQEPNDKSLLPPPPPQSLVPSTKIVDNSYQQRYKTFSKRTSTLKSPVSILNPALNPVENKEETKPSLIKPEVRQIQPPRRLSKLPQMFQKSNPNLGSNLKPPHSGRLSMYAGVGFCKGSHPNISNNVPTLGNFKSERLLPRKTSTELSTSDGTSHSMESIDSTGSAHSAPDLDGRHSVASNSSRASYIIKPRNSNALNVLKSMEDRMEKFNGSTPKVSRHPVVLENNWVQEKDLPSPIFQNGVSKNHLENYSRSTSPSNSADFSAKTSSPLTNSPTNSDNTINTISDGGIEALKENIQATENAKPKQQLKAPSTINKGTMLRRPSNWTGASNKVASAPVSGIPRPASRIPAPRFTKPNKK